MKSQEIRREVSNKLVDLRDDAKILVRRLNDASFMPGGDSPENIHKLFLRVAEMTAKLQNLEKEVA